MLAINSQKQIYYWLFTCAFSIIIMVVIGGITRLTDSGLSMTDWNFFSGVIPPTNNDDWNSLFQNYKLYPEYKFINFDMTLDEFKKIFFWEYLHRVWGRIIGLIFFIPFIYFLIKKTISKKLLYFLIPVSILGCFQGFMGWYMVSSGLVHDPDVSQYRLASHLGIAFILYCSLLYKGWDLFRQENDFKSNIKETSLSLTSLLICFSLVFLTALSGAFVAGTNAGLAYNNFPYMGPSIFPPDAFTLQPLWKNFFENIGLIQFNHRIFASVTAFFLIYVSIHQLKYGNNLERKVLKLLIIFVSLQYLLGILVVILYVPIPIGVLHQFGSLIILSLLTILISECYTKKKG